MLAVADLDNSLIITGNGDVLEPEQGIVAIGSGGAYAQAAARGLIENTELDARRSGQEIPDHRRRPVHLHQSLPHHRGAEAVIEAALTGGLTRCTQDVPMTQMTPPEIVSELDKHIVGQGKAKKAVAVALRNRWRRAQVAEPLKSEITPKNILMIGPTGVGKTEIARRLARLANAPFIKIEATKFTEVGYVGRDVDTIIRDLVEIAIKSHREQAMKKVRDRAQDAAEDRVLDILLPPARRRWVSAPSPSRAEDNATRQKFRKKLREGELDDKEIEIEVGAPSMSAEIFAPPGMEELTQQIQGMFQNMGGGKKKQRKLKIREAMKLLTDEEAARMINDEEVKLEAVRAVEQNGIVFLDEVDKIAARTDAHGADVSRQGVQRDLLAAGRGHDDLHQVRHDQDRSHPVHRQRRLSPVQAVRPHPRAAGTLPDPRRARVAVGRGLRAHPHEHRRLPRPPVRGLARHRRGTA
jgi:hypothetical protein